MLDVTAPTRVLVTGSSDGIGAEIADQLAARGMSVVRHARNAERVARCREHAGPGAPVVVGDLASLESTRAMADQATRLGPFDVIVHNAGWASTGADRPVTVDGIEQTLQVNAVAPYLLSALIPLPRRLVYVSSDSIRHARLDLTDLQHEREWDPARAYADSKLVLTAFALFMARHYPGLTVNAVHPGWVRSKMSGDVAPLSLSEGADTPVWLACADDPGARVSGELFHERSPVRYNEAAHDPATQDAVVRALEALSGVRLPRGQETPVRDQGQGGGPGD